MDSREETEGYQDSRNGCNRFGDALNIIKSYLSYKMVTTYCYNELNKAYAKLAKLINSVSVRVLDSAYKLEVAEMGAVEEVQPLQVEVEDGPLLSAINNFINLI